MIDTRAVGQELQESVLAAARKGQQRVTTTVKTVTATAQQIRPQLPSLPRPTLNIPSLPRPTLNIPSLPRPAQIREKALAAKLPSTEQVRSSAHELAGQFLSAQRKIVDQVLARQSDFHELAGQFLSAQRKIVGQVRNVTAPLAEQAASVFTQVGKPTAKPAETVAELREPSGTEHGKTEHRRTEHGKAEHGKAEHGKAAHGKPEHGKPEHGKTAGNGAGAGKPKAKSAAK